MSRAEVVKRLEAIRCWLTAVPDNAIPAAELKALIEDIEREGVEG